MVQRSSSLTRILGLAAATALLVSGTIAGAPTASSVPTVEGATSAGNRAADGRLAPVLLPNARALPAAKFYIRRDGSGHRVLRFESGLASTGRGPLEVRPNDLGNCGPNRQHASQILYRDRDRNRWYKRSVDKKVARRDAGCIVFHPSHDHWHFEAAARYALWDPDRRREPVVVSRRKMSFCLRDTEKVPPRWATRDYPQHYGDCHRGTPQGISIGWVDIYGNYLPGQFLTLPNAMPTGLYCMRTTVDPTHALRESSDTDNSSVRSIRISGERVTLKPFRRCRSVL